MLVPSLVAAFALGFAARAIGLPPLAGYLVAGFLLHAFGVEADPGLQGLADVGVLLLLFGIGLKLRLRTLARREVLGTAGAFAVIGSALAAALLLGLGSLGLPLVRELNLPGALALGFAFSFSSTVFAVKALEETGESASLAGRLAVGVLILQDVFAVLFLVLVAGKLPSPSALLLLPLLALARPLLGWMLDRSGHGEVLVLFGFAVAITLGGAAFEEVGLKPDLGALVVGMLLSGHPRASELSERLLAFKDLFLIGFFLSIGLEGAPPPAAWALGLGAVALVPLRSLGLLWLYTRFRLRARTALHASLTLSTFSEFGLIVGAAAVQQGLVGRAWVSALGVAVAGSFVAASFLNARRYRLYDRWKAPLGRLEREPIQAEDAIIDCGSARVLVFGMGRVGTGAYDQLIRMGRRSVVGVDREVRIVEAHAAEQRSAIRGDALDRDFWERVRFHPEVELVVAAMNNHRANLELVSRVREYLPAARIAAIATYPDQQAELRNAGVDVARNLYAEAGQGLADDAVSVGLGPSPAGPAWSR